MDSLYSGLHLVPWNIYASLTEGKPMVCLPHETGFLFVPKGIFPAFVRRLMDLDRARYNCEPLTDLHWNMTLETLGTEEALRNFTLNLLEGLAMATNSRVSDVLKDQMKAQGAATGTAPSAPGQASESRVSEGLQDALATNPTRELHKKYDPDELWKAIEHISKGGG